MNKVKGCFVVMGMLAIGIWLWHVYTTPKVKTAQVFESKGNYEAAYEAYAKVIVERSKKFKAPLITTATSLRDIPKWLSSLLADYVSYRVSQPQETDCAIAHRKLHELESQLYSLDHTFHQDEDKTLTVGDFVSLWKSIAYPNQKTLPEPDRKAAEAASHVTSAL